MRLARATRAGAPGTAIEPDAVRPGATGAAALGAGRAARAGRRPGSRGPAGRPDACRAGPRGSRWPPSSSRCAPPRRRTRSRHPRRPGRARPRPSARPRVDDRRPRARSPHTCPRRTAFRVRPATPLRTRGTSRTTYTWHSAVRSASLPVTVSATDPWSGGACAGGPQARRAARDRRGLRVDATSRWAPRRSSSGTTSASRPATIRNDMAALEEEGYIAQPHTSAGPHPDRQGLPAVRRPALDGQAAVRAPSAGPSQTFLDGARRPRRRRRPHRAAARPADPPGRRRAVPLAVPLAAVRHVELVPLGADPAAAGAHHRHRPGRAARGRAAGDRSADDVLAELRAHAQRRRRGRAAGRRRRAGWPSCPTRFPTTEPAGRAGVLPVLLETLVEQREERDRARRHRQPRALGPTSRARSGRCSRRWRSRSCCCGCSARSTTRGADGADRQREPARGAHRAPRS